MDQKPHAEDSVQEEIEALGRNLVGALRSAWESPETRRMRDDVVNGLSELGNTLRQEVDNLHKSDTARQVRSSVGQAAEKVRGPEVQARVRGEVLNALKTLNGELQRLIDRMTDDDDAPQEVVAEAAEDLIPPSNIRTPAQPASARVIITPAYQADMSPDADPNVVDVYPVEKTEKVSGPYPNDTVME